MPSLDISATCVRVPVPVGHSVSLHARFQEPVSVIEAREVLSRAEGVQLRDDPANDVYPSPLEAAGIDDVLVGRIRQPEGHEDELLLFACGDSLRKGAALNAVQIADDRAFRRSTGGRGLRASDIGSEAADLAWRCDIDFGIGRLRGPIGKKKSCIHGAGPPKSRASPALPPRPPTRAHRVVGRQEPAVQRRQRPDRDRPTRSAPAPAGDTDTTPHLRDHPPGPSVLGEQRVLDREHHLARHRRVPASLEGPDNVEQPPLAEPPQAERAAPRPATRQGAPEDR